MFKEMRISARSQGIGEFPHSWRKSIWLERAFSGHDLFGHNLFVEQAIKFLQASIPVRLRSGIRYLAAQVIIISTIFGTRNSMTEPPRFLPMASMSPDLNLRAAIPIKKGVAAIIAVLLIHPIWSDTAHGVCAQGIPPTLGGGGAGSRDNLEEGPLPVAPLQNNLCQQPTTLGAVRTVPAQAATPRSETRLKPWELSSARQTQQQDP